jgi:hypothetical protein
VLTCSTLAPSTPAGSWSQSCTPLIWNRGILAATCTRVQTLKRFS